jgi:hypothetical protein
MLDIGPSLIMRPPDSNNWLPLRILTANVGNLSWECQGRYNNKLCYTAVESAIADSIKRLKPDIVFLQELLHPAQCEGWLESDSRKVCYRFGDQAEQYQPRRLLGNNYTVACFARARSTTRHPVGLECIAVHVDVGTIEGCEPEELCLNVGRMDFPGSECNPEFVVASVVARLHGVRIGLVNAHLSSREVSCREVALRQIFKGDVNSSALASEPFSVIAGDFNLDPFRERGSLTRLWNQYVGAYGSNRPFYYHSGPAEHRPPYATARFLFGQKTVDHLLSNFALGICTTLGEAPGTQRMDRGWGMDHRAVMCDLWIPLSPNKERQGPNDVINP